MRLYHATLKSNLDGIIEKGIDPSFSKGAEQVIWLHTAGVENGQSSTHRNATSAKSRR